MAKDERFVKQITAKSEDFSRWYQEIIRKTQLADYAPMKGLMIIRPDGYAPGFVERTSGGFSLRAVGEGSPDVNDRSIRS